MKNRPLVTVVTPSFNQGEFIEETIQSVLNQNYPEIEYWIIDGGSKDNTLEILQKYQYQGVHFVSEKDEGQADAIQKGFDRANGEIIGWINSDDILLPDAVAKIVNAFTKSQDVGIVYGDVIFIDNNGNFLKDFKPGVLDVHRLLNVQQSVSQPGSFFRKSAFQHAGGLDKSLRYVMDYDLFIRLLSTSKGIYIPEPLARFRLHSNSKSHNFMTTRFIFEAFKVSRRYQAKLISRLNYIRAKTLGKACIKYMLGMPTINYEKLKKERGQ